jgi:predicted HAD superfamily Cof-like phosphohydrolase
MASIHDVMFLHEKMGHAKARLPKPGFLPDKFMEMRLNFALEELQEFATACGCVFDNEACLFSRDESLPQNLEEAFDGLLDKVYVDFGTADLMGFSHPGPGRYSNMSIWQEGFARVHNANMKKVPVVNASESSRGFNIDLKKPKGWLKPQFKDLLV